MTVASVATPAIVSGLEGLKGTESRFYHSDERSIYALPTDAEEFDRLTKQHALILHLFNGPISAPSIVERLKQAQSGAGPKLKVLDVGCGPGSWIKQIAQEYPAGADCHACDFVSSFAHDEGIPTSIDFKIGNVLEKLPYPDANFDLVHMRFFTGALKTEQWSVAVQELKRVVKVGGWVQMVEPDGELRSEGHVSEKLRDWNERGMRGSLKKRGGDPSAGTRLDQLLSDAGFNSVEKYIRSAPIGRTDDNDALGALMEHDYKSLVHTLAPVLCQSWALTPQQMASWGEEVVEECKRVHAFHNFVTAVGQK